LQHSPAGRVYLPAKFLPTWGHMAPSRLSRSTWENPQNRGKHIFDFLDVSRTIQVFLSWKPLDFLGILGEIIFRGSRALETKIWPCPSSAMHSDERCRTLRASAVLTPRRRVRYTYGQAPYGPQPFVRRRVARHMAPSRLHPAPQTAAKSAPPEILKKNCCSLQLRFLELKNPGNFRDVWGDHFAWVESSGDQNLTMFVLHFHAFLHFWPPQKAHKNERFSKTLQTPAPWDHAQTIELEKLYR